ncbi:IS3 family transposase [Streptomyces sp. MNU76]|uniref:IS3 family transposase n=1 Tax=Streptomyces sp. MNU76 TaxID=2560026 RepID=UPI0035A98791
MRTGHGPNPDSPLRLRAPADALPLLHGLLDETVGLLSDAVQELGVRDAELKTLITEAYEANYRVHSAWEIWRHLNRQGVAVARCTVECLMRELGITGAVRGKKVITTVPDASAERAPPPTPR